MNYGLIESTDMPNRFTKKALTVFVGGSSLFSGLVCIILMFSLRDIVQNNI